MNDSINARTARTLIASLARVYRLGIDTADRLRIAGPTLARIAVGWVFLVSGWGKLHALENVASYFADLGLPAPMLQAAMASTTELVCGALLLAGLATRAAAIPLIVVMMVAIRTALWERVDSAVSLFGLAEFLYIVLLGWLATTGPGPLSLDALIQRALSRRSRAAAAPAYSRAAVGSRP